VGSSRGLAAEAPPAVDGRGAGPQVADLPIDPQPLDTQPFDTLPVAPATLLAALDRQGPLLDWQSREALAAAELELAIADKRPDWSVGAAYGQRQGSRSDMLMLEVSVDLPLFPGNRQDRDIAARRAELDAVAAAREDARRQQRARVEAALAQWSALRHQVRRDREQLLPLARDRAQAAIAGYRAGGPLQPWLEARRDEIQVRLDHVQRLDALGRTWAALAFLLPPDAAQGDLPAPFPPPAIGAAPELKP
ncbi:MAG: TolC family protein, partial [Pseudomonadota bacterium]|nr:TolC family protein [Pseudomonadota bacterium]